MTVKKKVAKTGVPQKDNLGALRAVLAAFKSKRNEKDELVETVIPEMQREILAALQTLDPDGKGVVFVLDGEELAGFYQQNNASVFWDVETLIPFLRKNKQRWMSVSSRVFDVQKFEAEVANGNIPPKTVAKYKKTGDVPKPFVRIGKPQKESLR